MLLTPLYLCLLLQDSKTLDISTATNLLADQLFNPLIYGRQHFYRDQLSTPKPTQQGPVLFPNDTEPPPRRPLVVTSKPLAESIAKSDLNPTPKEPAINAEETEYNQQIFYPQYLSKMGNFQPYNFGYIPGYNPEIFNYGNDVYGNGIDDYGASFNGRENGLLQSPYSPEDQKTLAMYKDLVENAKQRIGSGILIKRKLRYPKLAQNSNDVEDKEVGHDHEHNDLSRDLDYAFSYSVKDQHSGDDFSHSQQSKGTATNGEYRVKLPDGRVQIVSYVADNNGYHADVRYDRDDDFKYHGNPMRYTSLDDRNDLNDKTYHDRSSDVNYGTLIKKQQRNLPISEPRRIPVMSYFGQGYDGYHNVFDNFNNNNGETKHFYYDGLAKIDVPSRHKHANNDYKNNEDNYADSKEIVENDYSDIEYDDFKHRSKFSSLAKQKASTIRPIIVSNDAENSNFISSTVLPSIANLRKQILQRIAASSFPASSTSIPVELNVPSTTPRTVQNDQSGENVVLIGGKQNLYTNIHNTLQYDNNGYTTPQSYLESTISSLRPKNVDISDEKPRYDTFVNRISKYLSFK